MKMEQIRILEIIDRWGSLNVFQIALLLNKSFETVKSHLRVLKAKQLILVDQLTRKNIYFLSSLGIKHIGKKKKVKKVNYFELKHQALTIRWLVSKNNIVSYENDLELKSFNSTRDSYPDLMVTFKDGTGAVVEIERSIKEKHRVEQKLDNLRQYIKDNYSVIWVVPNDEIKRFIERQLDNYDFYRDKHTIELFPES